MWRRLGAAAKATECLLVGNKEKANMWGFVDVTARTQGLLTSLFCTRQTPMQFSLLPPQRIAQEAPCHRLGLSRRHRAA